MAKQKEKVGNPFKKNYEDLNNDQPKKEQRELSEVTKIKQQVEKEAPEEPKELTPLMKMFADRPKQKSIFFDTKTHTQILLIKGNTNIDIKDFVYFATIKEIQRLFPNGEIENEEYLNNMVKEFEDMFGSVKQPKQKEK